MTATPPALPLPGATRGRTLIEAPHRIHLLRAIAITAGTVIPLLFIGRGAAAILVPTIGVMVAVALHWPRGAAPLRDAFRRPHAGAVATALAAMFALWLPSVAGSLKPGFSFAIWLQVLGLVLLMACLPAVLAERDAAYRWTLRALLLMALAGGAVAALSLLVWPKMLELVRPVKITSDAQPVNYLKSYAAVMPCLAPALLWAGCRLGGAWRAAALAGIALGVVVVFATHNRAALGGYAGLLLVAGGAIALRRAARPWRIAAAAAVGAAALAAVALVIARLPTMPFEGPATLRLPTWLVDAHRQAIWGFVLDRAVERPWFGWGPSTANFLPGADTPVPGIGQTFVPLHAHNWLLQLFNDVGAVGLAAALAALAVFMLHLDRRYRSGDRAALAGLALTGAFFVSTLANFSIWQGWWQSVYAVLMPILLAGGRQAANAAATR